MSDDEPMDPAVAVPPDLEPSDERAPGDEGDLDHPAVVGVPPEVPEAVKPSATGVVVGPTGEDSDDPAVTGELEAD